MGCESTENEPKSLMKTKELSITVAGRGKSTADRPTSAHGLPRMTHFRTKMYVGQDQGVGQDLFLEPS
jgi:hypothetical protein